MDDCIPGPVLLSYSFDGTVTLFDAENGSELSSLIQGHNHRNPIRDSQNVWKFHYNLEKHRQNVTTITHRTLTHTHAPERRRETRYEWGIYCISNEEF